MNRFYLIPVLCAVLAFTTQSITAQKHTKAVICVPVADLVDPPLKPNKKKQTYQNIPLDGDFSLCPRLHQAVFNEVVEVIDTRGIQVQIRIPNLVYITRSSSEPRSTYWTLKKNIITFNRLKKKNIDSSKIPQPITVGSISQCDSTIVTLIEPFHDEKTRRTYSVGTRFVRAPQNDSQAGYGAYILNSHGSHVYITTIPTNLCILNTPRSPEQRTKLFVDLILRWAHRNHGYIPYVWGGCSFVTPAYADFFERTAHLSKQTTGTEYVIPNLTGFPKTGFDCSGLIARAAQIAGIPYYAKNTTTIGQHLEPLKKHERISQGDIILIRGHVMVVADVEKNTLFEAGSYKYGHGKIHEIPLKKVFKGIKTYDQLVNAYVHNKNPVRLNSKGEVLKKVENLKIMRFASV